MIRRRRRRRGLARHTVSQTLGYLAWLALMVTISPFGLLGEVFRGRRAAGRSWILYYMIFCLCLLLAWIGVSSALARYERGGAAVLSRFSYGKTEVKDCPFAKEINFYALKNDLDPSLVAAVMAQESAFNPNAVSPKGARGLMQLMPGVFRELNPETKCSGDHAPPTCGQDCIFDPVTNIKLGTKLLRTLLDRFNGDVMTALAAYNAGGEAAQRYQGNESSDGLPPFPETQEYARSIARLWPGFRERGWQPVIARTLRQVSPWFAWINLGTWCLLFLWVVRRVRL